MKNSQPQMTADEQRSREQKILIHAICDGIRSFLLFERSFDGINDPQITRIITKPNPTKLDFVLFRVGSWIVTLWLRSAALRYPWLKTLDIAKC